MDHRVVESGKFETHNSRSSLTLLTHSPGSNNGGQSETLFDMRLGGSTCAAHTPVLTSEVSVTQESSDSKSPDWHRGF